jgi:fumarate reductase subunit C
VSVEIPSALRREVRLWVLQRVSAAILALCVVVHLATMIHAVSGGLSAGEILGRTRGNVAWAAFYSVFVIAAAVHSAIGLRTIAAEWAGWRGDTAEVAITVFGGGLVVLGLRAVAAVFGSGS